MKEIVIVSIFIIVILFFLTSKSRENLSLSQILTSKDCSCLIKKPAPVLAPYSKDTVIACNVPGDKSLRLKNCSFYSTYSPDTSCPGCESSGCSSCRSKKTYYDNSEDCFQSSPGLVNTTDIPLPPIKNIQLIKKTTIKNISKTQIQQHLEQGDLIVAAKSPEVIENLLIKLKFSGGNGYPDFYYIDGPVVLLTKDGRNYYYVIDYPIKYNPKNIKKYINTTPYSDYALDAWFAGSRMLEGCYPVYIYKNNKPVKQNSPKKPNIIKGECCKSVWGVPYGCGDWTQRV